MWLGYATKGKGESLLACWLNTSGDEQLKADMLLMTQYELQFSILKHIYNI